MLKVAKLGGYKILGSCTLFCSFATVIERGGDRVLLPQCLCFASGSPIYQLRILALHRP